jgi:thiol:disulfide interchange protein DsbD
MPTSAGPVARGFRAAVIALAVMGALELTGAVLGAADPLAPLTPIAMNARGPEAVAELAPRFKTVDSGAALEGIVAAAGRPVLVDFYADWCTACQEMERSTFTDPAVQQLLGRMALVRVDVTANLPQQRDLLKRFGLFGPPGLVVFDAKGHELSAARLVGFAEPAALRAHLLRFMAP